MERRTILKLAAAGVLPGSASLVQIACSQDGYSPEFFSRSQLELLDSLADVILPADDHSPGARAAKVARYIDVVVADGTDQDRQRWLAGLDAVSRLAEDRFGQGFAECDAGQQDEIVAGMARGEDSPQSDADRFFVLMKRTIIDGYYTSQVGIHDELGYRGNTAVDEFPGCTHNEHG